MMRHFLDFERPIAELEGKIEELRHLATTSEINIADEVGRLENSANRLLRQTYARLTPWQKVQVARHPERPHCLDYIGGLITEFVPLAGDRAFAEDAAVIGGIGRFAGAASWRSAPRRATTRRQDCATTSEWRDPKAIAKHAG